MLITVIGAKEDYARRKDGAMLDYELGGYPHLK